MADRALLLREDLYRLTDRINEKFSPGEVYWDLLCVLLIVWLMGFMCGFGCAVKIWPLEHRPKCQCRCVDGGCPHRPGKGYRRLCNVCGLLVGPGCCWLGDDVGRCHMCAPDYEPDPEPRGTKTMSRTRTLGTQSQTTYKRKLLTPRFHVLPEVAGGVFVD